MIKSITWRRTFYSSGGLAPSCHLVFLFNLASSPFLSRWPIRIRGHPDPDFRGSCYLA